jgi:hypothetical protein
MTTELECLETESSAPGNRRHVTGLSALQRQLERFRGVRSARLADAGFIFQLGHCGRAKCGRITAG